MDIIFIRDLAVEAAVGIYDHERISPQALQINLQIALPSRKACATDEIGDTIDYGAVTESIRRMLGQRRFNLVETLAERVARLLIEDFGAPWVQVEVAKGPVVPGVRQVGVVIERIRTPGSVRSFWRKDIVDHLAEAE
ncbi:MAG: dihydroneopterin aldolase [Betaproteobacteria bacterium]|nr:dihydroneopterin aldolase [Betaproteobacteria bacterium]